MARFDFSVVFPPKGDPRHPPLWLWRALIWIAAFFFLCLFLYDSVPKLAELISVVLIAAFFGMALEPGVDFFVRKGVNKSLATIISIFAGLGVIIGALVLFGSIFTEQVVALFQNVPKLYYNIEIWVRESFNIEIPSAPDFLLQIAKEYSGQISGQAVSISFGAFTLVINLLAMLLIMYYMCAHGDAFRKSVASLLPAERQKDFIRLFTITQTKIGSFLGSRLILAIISIVFMSVVGILMNMPYWLPIAIFMGVVGQFVPTVGVYIGGGLPVLVALASLGPIQAVILLVIIIVYQNLENMIIMPKVSQEALDLNPAVAFLSVLAFGYLWGAVGAFLALPVVATIVTVFKFVIKRHDLLDLDEIAVNQRAELATHNKQSHEKLKMDRLNAKIKAKGQK